MKQTLFALILAIPAAAFPAERKKPTPAPPRLEAPAVSVEAVAQAGLLVNLDGRLRKAPSEAIIPYQGSVLVHQPGRKHDEFSLIVRLGRLVGDQVIDQYGSAKPVESDSGPLEWCIVVPAKGTWSVLVFDHVSRSAEVLSLSVGVVPKPDDPDPPPPGPVTEAPFAAPGFAVMVIREAQDSGSQGQMNIYTSSKVLGYVSGNCVEASDGKPFVRIWDDDYTDSQLNKAPPDVVAAYRKVKESAESLPWMAITDGKSGWQGPLPNTIDETLSVLKKWGDK